MRAISIHAEQINGKYEPYSRTVLLNSIRVDFFFSSQLPTSLLSYTLLLFCSVLILLRPFCLSFKSTMHLDYKLVTLRAASPVTAADVINCQREKQTLQTNYY